MALLGPNGAGKTTTLLTCSGIVKVLEGSVTILGEPVHYGAPHRMARRGLGHVPRTARCSSSSPWTRTSGSACAASRVRRSRPTTGRWRCSRPWRPCKDRRAGLLSGGEQQMLAVARALVAQPKVLMIDEMSLGLAPIIVERMLPLVRQIADETGAGVLLVEQHIHMALTVADRAYVMNHGEVVLEGSGKELAGRRDLLEASYLGDKVL